MSSSLNDTRKCGAVASLCQQQETNLVNYSQLTYGDIHRGRILTFFMLIFSVDYWPCPNFSQSNLQKIYGFIKPKSPVCIALLSFWVS
jgi:hypothetical protein